jgi:hypothetical protein
MRNTWMGFGRQAAVGTFSLTRDATFRPGSGVVRVDRGVVLATQPGDLEDHVLVAGTEFRPGRRGGVVLWALEDAVVSVAPVGAPRRAAEPAACAA